MGKEASHSIVISMDSLSNGRYILDGHVPVPEPDLLKWAKAFEDDAYRRVAKTDIGDIVVSTVFLGLDHNFRNILQEVPRQNPLLFETMVFGGPLDQEQDRYSTWEEAEKGHEAMVVRVKENL